MDSGRRKVGRTCGTVGSAWRKPRGLMEQGRAHIWSSTKAQLKGSGEPRLPRKGKPGGGSHREEPQLHWRHPVSPS